MKKKVIILLLSVFICSTKVLCQTIDKLTNEQKTWLSKANRHEKNGWIYLHIEGSPEERGFQHGFLLAKEIKESIRVDHAAPVNRLFRQIGFFGDNSLLQKLPMKAQPYVEYPARSVAEDLEGKNKIWSSWEQCEFRRLFGNRRGAEVIDQNPGALTVHDSLDAGFGSQCSGCSGGNALLHEDLGCNVGPPRFFVGFAGERVRADSRCRTIPGGIGRNAGGSNQVAILSQRHPENSGLHEKRYYLDRPNYHQPHSERRQSPVYLQFLGCLVAGVFLCWWGISLLLPRRSCFAGSLLCFCGFCFLLSGFSAALFGGLWTFWRCLGLCPQYRRDERHD